MRRREFSVLVGSAALYPFAVRAQQPAMLRVGTANVQVRAAPQWVAFVRRMAELGYREGKNFTFDFVQIPGTPAWEASYCEVVGRKADIIIAPGPELSLKSALAAAPKLPIVMIAVDYNPLARRYVASLARLGGHVTGVYFRNVDLAGKLLQLAKEAFPDMTAMTVFWDRLSAEYWAALQKAAPRLGIRLTGLELRKRPYRYERVLTEVSAEDRKYFIAHASPYFFLDRVRLAEFALKHRMAWISGVRQLVVAGALMSYGAQLTDMWVLAATYVDQIAKGAKPSDLPIQRPTKFELVINGKTAKALGITFPRAFLSEADDVIE